MRLAPNDFMFHVPEVGRRIGPRGPLLVQPHRRIPGDESGWVELYGRAAVSGMGMGKGTGCRDLWSEELLPPSGPTSAQEMLKYIAATLGVEYLRDEPVPQERTAKVQKKVDDSNAAYANLNTSSKYPTLHQTSELAWAEVRSKNGTFTMKGRMRAQVSCTERVNPPLASMTDHKKKEPTTVDTCQALLLYEAAPESQYPALAEEWDRPGMGPRLLDSWVRAWVTRRTTSSENSFIENERRLSWEAKVQDSENVRKKMIAEFDVVLQKGLDKVLADAAEKSQRNDSLSPDWTDYLLNRDLMGNDSRLKLQNSAGPFSKWVDDTGKKMFETKDPDSDPNGILPGTWIEHGGTHKHATVDAPGAANSASPSSTRSIESRFGWVQSGGLLREPSGKPDETTSNACGPRRSSLAARPPTVLKFLALIERR